tara:strand:+ start:980 stop:1333 length:354 start_codon:yes stop_codon:yes gene_type:complete
VTWVLIWQNKEMKKRFALAAYLLIFLYGCITPLQKNICETGYIDRSSFWNEYIDEYLFFDTCRYKGVLLGQKPKYVTDNGRYEPMTNKNGIIFSWLTFLFLWLIRWTITGKHFWQEP